MSGRGLLAGAVGTTVLNAATYLDMALSGRSASDAPARTVLAAADAAGVELPTAGGRGEAYGALAGLATGVGLGVAAAGLRRGGVRLPLLAEAAVVGGAAMAATDGPMHALGVSDVSTWSTRDWGRDAIPHYAYGLGVSATLRALERRDPARAATVPRRLRTVLAKGFAVGVATGARSSLGLVTPALASDATLPRLAVAGLVATELTVDKLPSTSDRIAAGPFVARGLLGAAGSLALARDDDVGTFLPAVAGAAGAAVGTAGGWLLREAGARRGLTWPVALVEDGLALGLTRYAARS